MITQVKLKQATFKHNGDHRELVVNVRNNE